MGLWGFNKGGHAYINAVLLQGFCKRGPKGPPKWKKKGPQAPTPSTKKAAIQSHRINKVKRMYTHALKVCVGTLKSKSMFGGLWKHTNTACILDPVSTYTVLQYKEVSHLKSKTRQRLASHEVWNFSKLVEPTLKHSMKHPWPLHHPPPLTPPLSRSLLLFFF